MKQLSPQKQAAFPCLAQLLGWSKCTYPLPCSEPSACAASGWHVRFLPDLEIKGRVYPRWLKAVELHQGWPVPPFAITSVLNCSEALCLLKMWLTNVIIWFPWALKRLFSRKQVVLVFYGNGNPFPELLLRKERRGWAVQCLLTFLPSDSPNLRTLTMGPAL